MRPMDPEEIDACIADRFERWGRFLSENQATPFVVVALGQPGALRDRHQLVTCCPEGTDTDDIVRALEAGILMIRQGREEYR